MSVTDQKTEASEFDAYADSYDEAVNGSLRFLGMKVDYFTRVKGDYLLDQLAQHFGDSKGLALLDVGCGVGNYHGLLADRVGSISGVDLSQDCLAQAAQRNPGVRYSHYDGSRLPFADASFDAVFTICVMHHVPPAQWPAFVAEMKRVARKGGLVLVFEHNPLNPLTRRVVSNCDFDRGAVLLRQGQTRKLLDRAGLTNIRSNSILSIPSSGPVSRAVDLLLGRLSLGAQYFVRATV
jgi:ubiquinone/menaquinone biosynthesis C-methylase UbiE